MAMDCVRRASCGACPMFCTRLEICFTSYFVLISFQRPPPSSCIICIWSGANKQCLWCGHKALTENRWPASMFVLEWRRHMQIYAPGVESQQAGWGWSAAGGSASPSRSRQACKIKEWQRKMNWRDPNIQANRARKVSPFALLAFMALIRINTGAFEHLRNYPSSSPPSTQSEWPAVKDSKSSLLK